MSLSNKTLQIAKLIYLKKKPAIVTGFETTHTDVKKD